MRAKLVVGPLSNEDSEKGVFLKPLASRVSCLLDVAKGWFEFSVEAEFNQSVCYVEGFLGCQYQVKALQKLLTSLDDTLIDEPSDEDLL